MLNTCSNQCRLKQHHTDIVYALYMCIYIIIDTTFIVVPVHMMSMLGWSSAPRCLRYWDSDTVGWALEAQYSEGGGHFCK